ncbi:MAG: segregation/condensation protein A [Treponema sp.]|jgi:segregation and condensation protein A|nr:segregation/condensation protein A [Treponema sp.]
MESAEKKSRHFKLNEFEGPLDLLLFLINKNEINIYDTPIAQITEQYLDYIVRAGVFDLDEASEFHVMTARLLYIKSVSLLPGKTYEDDADDPRRELVEQLIEYQKIKKLSELMEEKERETEWVIERKKLQKTLPFADEDLWEEADIWDLLKTFSALMRDISGERIIDLYEEISVNEKITLLAELLETRGECSFTDLVARNGSVMDIVCAFLAILEAAKIRTAVVFQNRMFGDILIRPSRTAA